MLADLTYFLVEGLVSEVIFPILAGLFGRAESPVAAWFKGLGWLCLIVAGGGTGLACWWSPVGPLARWAALVVVIAGFAALALGFAARVANQCVAPVAPKPTPRRDRSGHSRAAGEA